MGKKLKKYRINPNESLCLAVSVVDSPAVESEFVCLGKQEMEKFVAVDKPERRMIYGCALRADFPIYRNNGEQEYYIEFGADSIDKISKDFIKNGFQKNWTVGHEAEIEGLSVTESWIKESMTMDKSVALGLDPSLPVGSWFIGCYCENDEVWEKVKNGTYHGFSCEALVGLEEFEKQITDKIKEEELAANSGFTNVEEFSKEDKNENNMNIETNEMFWDKLKNTFKEIFSSMTKEEKEAVAELNNVTVDELSKLTELSGFTSVEEYEKEVEAIREELAEETPAEPVAEPTPAPEPTPEPEPKVEEPKPEPTPEPEPKVEEPKDNHLEELVNSLKEEINALKEMNTGLQEKIKDLGKQPSAAPINTHAKPSAGDTYSAWREQMRNYIR